MPLVLPVAPTLDIGKIVTTAVDAVAGAVTSTTAAVVGVLGYLVSPGTSNVCTCSTDQPQVGTPASTSQQGTVNTDPITSSRSTLPRDAAGNYVPHPDAEGAHTNLGTRVGHDGVPYTQGATFDSAGRFVGRTDVTDHGRGDHADPHFHPATGPASVGPAQAIPQD